MNGESERERESERGAPTCICEQTLDEARKHASEKIK